tara:strand:- start:405 stop:1091 length:687 start_codon:yes stop_codon:yes gene_type:complete
MNAAEAEKFLGLGRSAVNRLVRSGVLRSERNGKGNEIDEASVRVFRFRREAHLKLRKREEELFALTRCGVPSQDIEMEYDVSEQEILGALWFYDRTRKKRFATMDLSGIEGVVYTAKEITKRLRVKARHVLAELRDNEVIRFHQVGVNGRSRYFADRDSFHGYLGDRMDEILYNSREIRDRTGLTVKRIDEIAIKHSLGMKLKKHDPGKSMYLFTEAEISFMREVSRD